MSWSPGDRIRWDDLTEARRTFIGNPYQLTGMQLVGAGRWLDACMPSIPAAMGDLCERGVHGDARKMVLAAMHHGARRAAAEGEAGVPRLRQHLATLELAVEHCRVLGLRLTSNELRRLTWALHRFYVADARLIGSSAAMRHVRESLWTASFGPNLYVTLERQLAIRQQNILLLGEPGTGKELVAAILQAAVVTDGEAVPPSLSINCAAIPSELAEAELFGTEKGAHSKADVRRQGKIAAASRGTLFLDEVADLSASVQAKLLSVLANGKLTPLGGNDVVTVDVRYVSATARPLFAMVQEGKVREDLFGRLGQTIIDLPPLRDRPEDIAEIARALLMKLTPGSDDHDAVSSQIATVDKAFEIWLRDDAAQAQWPGNVRELEAAVREHVLGFRRPTQARPSLLPAPGSAATDDARLESLPAKILDCTATDEEVGAWYLQRVLKHTKGNQSEAMRILRLDRGTIRRRMAKLAGKSEVEGEES